MELIYWLGGEKTIPKGWEKVEDYIREDKMKYKFCWLAREYKRGWRLGLCMGNKKPLYIPIWFSTLKDTKKVLKGNIVFVHLKEGEK